METATPAAGQRAPGAPRAGRAGRPTSPPPRPPPAPPYRPRVADRPASSQTRASALGRPLPTPEREGARCRHAASDAPCPLSPRASCCGCWRASRRWPTPGRRSWCLGGSAPIRATDSGPTRWTVPSWKGGWTSPDHRRLSGRPAPADRDPAAGRLFASAREATGHEVSIYGWRPDVPCRRRPSPRPVPERPDCAGTAGSLHVDQLTARSMVFGDCARARQQQAPGSKPPCLKVVLKLQLRMLELKQTATFRKWWTRLKRPACTRPDFRAA